MGVSLAFYGAEGFGLSVQSMALTSPYPLTAGQAALATVGLMYAACLGFSCLTLALFPINFANFSVLFSVLESYPLGPVVLDLIGMALIVYAVLALVATPVAALSFRRHQVA